MTYQGKHLSRYLGLITAKSGVNEFAENGLRTYPLQYFVTLQNYCY